MSSDKRPVLVITNPKDPHADAVIHFLNRMDVDVVRFHAGELNLDSSLSVTSESGSVHIQSSGRTFSLHGLRSCWYRRPDPVDVHTTKLDQPDRYLVTQETTAVLWGLYGCIESVWYSHPYNIRRAAWKLFQLRLAAAVGFNVPFHIVSNKPQDIRAFAEAHRFVVLKPIDEKTTAIDIGEQPMSLYVRKFRADDLAHLMQERPISPCFLQQYIQKAFDVRVTVIGQCVFAVAIRDSSNHEVVDWRVDSLNLQHDVIDCPDSVRKSLFSYLIQMGLNFGAFDFSVDTHGNWYFLECNPNGQWLWIEIKTGLTLAQTFAEHLALEQPPLLERAPILH